VTLSFISKGLSHFSPTDQRPGNERL